MRKPDEKVIAIFMADIHLSLKPPIWRSSEFNWFDAMARPLNDVSALQKKFDCPVICAGDIFDRWNSCPELINFALDYLPNRMYAIPGQHDLPLHKYDDIGKSAYWTLAQAGKIYNLQDTFSAGVCNLIDDSDIIIYAFPFGHSITSCTKDDRQRLQMAVVHEYIWIPGHSYPNAPVENLLKKCKGGKWMGYDMIVFGDNHKGFLTKRGNTVVFNCGTLMRRKSDEIDYKPQVGLLLSSGEIKIHYLDTSKDKYLDTITRLGKEEIDMSSFIKELEKLGDTAFDFEEAMKQFLMREKVSSKVKKIILEAMSN